MNNNYYNYNKKLYILFKKLLRSTLLTLAGKLSSAWNKPAMCIIVCIIIITIMHPNIYLCLIKLILPVVLPGHIPPVRLAEDTWHMHGNANF